MDLLPVERNVGKLQTLIYEEWDRDVPPYPAVQTKGWFRIMFWLLEKEILIRIPWAKENRAGDTTDEEFVEKAVEWKDRKLMALGDDP